MGMAQFFCIIYGRIFWQQVIISGFYKVIQPSTFATELISIMPMQTGARYFIKKLYIPFRLNAEDCSTSFVIASRPATRVIRKQVAKAAKGIIMEFVKKSKKSRIDIPRIEIKSRVLKPRAEAEPKTRMMAPISRLHFFRLHPS